jgi:hypothetical protein
MAWAYESDGGGWFEGPREIIQPKTHYIVNADKRIDCKSRSEAIKLARKLNKEESLVEKS